MLIEKTMKFIDKMEDEIRAKLIQHPILYAFIGGTGIVLFWRGVWHTADDVNLGSLASLFIGMVILVIIGLFVTEFLGNRLIVSGLVGEEKISKKEEGEIETEATQLKNLQSTLTRLEKKLEHIDSEMDEK